MYLIIFLFGVLIGNFTTTFLYRLPNNIGFTNKTPLSFQRPFCSKCKHPLRFYEYLPILSWISTRGRCNYCEDKISPSYLLLELAGGVLAMLCFYLYYDNSDVFFLKFSLSITSLLAIIIHFQYKKFITSVTLTLIIQAALLRTLQDHSLTWLSVFSIVSIFIMILAQHYDNISQETIHAILPASIFLPFWYLMLLSVLMVILGILKKKIALFNNYLYELSMALAMIGLFEIF